MNELLALHLAKEANVETIVDFGGAIVDSETAIIFTKYMKGKKKIQVVQFGFSWVRRFSLRSFISFYNIAHEFAQFA